MSTSLVALGGNSINVASEYILRIIKLKVLLLIEFHAFKDA
jgi:hypothetical protein